MNESAEPPSLDFFGQTDVGRRRPENEDQFLIASLRKAIQPLFTSLDGEWLSNRLHSCDAYLFVVADGVGGLSKGRQASGTAVEVLAEQITQTVTCFYGGDVDSEHLFLDQLEEAMARADERVKAEYSGSDRAATTLTMVTLRWPRGYVVHVGDSRGYYLRQGRLRQFTRDQTMAEFMVDAGKLTEEQAATSPYSHVLTSALGGDNATPSLGIVDFEDGDVLLMCSDGLNRHVSDERIREILESADDAESSCNRLVDEALAGGGKDNITVVVVRMSAP